MPKEINYETALSRLAARCSVSEQCEHDLREKLSSWGIANEEQEKAIAWLAANKFFDDQRYAKAFVSDKSRFARWGRQKIAYQLRLKKIDDATIRNAMENIDEEEYEEQLFNMLKEKLRSMKYKNAFDAKGKLFRFAASRGFEMNQVSRVAQKLLSEINLDDTQDNETFFF